MEAKDRYYRFAVCPGFWDWLAYANQAAIIFSIQAVKKELIDGGGELAIRANGQLIGLFMPPDAPVVAAYAKVVTWVQGNAQYRQSAKAEFLREADPWLVA